MIRALTIVGLSLTVACWPLSSVAHGDGAAHGAHAAPGVATAEQQVFGIAGDPAQATRTIAIDMSDAMRFAPASIDVKLGETIRFELANRGVVMHEMVLGTRGSLEQHAAMMRTTPGMKHDAAWMTHVAPGSTGEIVWRFNRAGTFTYGCLVAGHFEAGMTGRVVVR